MATAVVKSGHLERDTVLKAKEQDVVESPSTLSSALATPRASFVATPKGSGKGTPRDHGTLAPKKYVSPMAKAREEKKRREAESNGKSKDWPSLSDMETSSNPSSGSVDSDISTGKVAKLPMFGEWDNHSVNSGPCYTILFQNAAQEKKIGGPVRVRANVPPSSPARTQDLYHSTPATLKAKKRMQYSFLCCFSS